MEETTNINNESTIEENNTEVNYDTLVKVVPSRNLRFFYGGRHYELIRGSTYEVPFALKEILKKGGNLQAF